MRIGKDVHAEMVKNRPQKKSWNQNDPKPCHSFEKVTFPRPLVVLHEFEDTSADQQPAQYEKDHDSFMADRISARCQIADHHLSAIQGICQDWMDEQVTRD
jgi:hypothetical protein